jgi:hypothetical protein
MAAWHKVWRALLSGADREQAFRAFEVATLLTLRRAPRNRHDMD